MANLDFQTFLYKLFTEIRSKGIDLSGLKCDHIAYRASSKEEYEQLSLEFKGLGQIVHEAIVNERRVSIFELDEPIVYEQFTIPALELIEPMAGQIINSGLEHAEFVVTSFEHFLNKYPKLDWNTKEMKRNEFPHLKLQLSRDMQVKFHPQGILEMIK